MATASRERMWANCFDCPFHQFYLLYTRNQRVATGANQLGDQLTKARAELKALKDREEKEEEKQVDT